jgi:anthranilate phosphoribosyltransferase
MRHVVPVRKELAVRTIFNFLGPLTNPAGATRQVIGVSDPRYLETIAAALAELGTERALVVSSADGLDELSASGSTRVVELKGGKIDSYELTPEQAGLKPVENGAIGAGTPDQNAEVVRRIFAGAAGPERSMAVLNAGAALYVGGQADSIADGVGQAGQALDSGAAAELLDRLVERSGELAEAQ